jgi:hypothetical protein
VSRPVIEAMIKIVDVPLLIDASVLTTGARR